jgi:hypothetical protein
LLSALFLAQLIRKIKKIYFFGFHATHYKKSVSYIGYIGGVLLPIKNEMANTTKNTRNRILAICEASAAIPVKPNSPAIRARTRKAIDQLSIKFLCNSRKCFYEIIRLLDGKRRDLPFQKHASR